MGGESGKVDGYGDAARRRGAFEVATQRMTELLLTERDSAAVLEALARIAGEVLAADRSLIYEIREERQELIALCEWLNPEVDVTPTKTTYPLGVFGAGNVEIKRTHSFLESHKARPHPALASDGSATILHEQMAIESLLWLPFSFHERGYFALVFNQVSHQRDWLPREREFLRTVTRYVDLALAQLKLAEERAAAERLLLETQKAETISMLAAGVAHDFNGLLGIVLGAVERARAALGSDSEIGSSLADASRAAREAALLAKHLLAYAGGGQFVVETIDVASLIAEMRDLLRAAATGVTINFALEGPLWIVGDAGQLRQLVMNFVVNAAEAVGDRAQGQVRVVARALAEPGTSEGAIVVSVQDNGCGMSAEVTRRIFEPFFSTKSLGRGLGLAAVAGIARSHGGRVSVESKEGAGTTISVRFDAAAPPAEASTATRASSDVTAERRAAGGATLLLVDDNDNFRRMCKSLLADLGFIVRDVSRGADAVEILRGRADAIDAAIIDLTMPECGGRETVRRLREVRPDLPIVIMSGYSCEEASDLFENRRACFIAKPFSLEELEGAVRGVLAQAPPNTVSERERPTNA